MGIERPIVQKYNELLNNADKRIFKTKIIVFLSHRATRNCLGREHDEYAIFDQKKEKERDGSTITLFIQSNMRGRRICF